MNAFFLLNVLYDFIRMYYIFKDDPENAYRRSDDLIAYTFKYFLEGHQDQPEAVLLLPMVKVHCYGLFMAHGILAYIFFTKSLHYFSFLKSLLTTSMNFPSPDVRNETINVTV